MQGTVRQSSSTGATILLVNGICLSFRLDPTKEPNTRNIVLVSAHRPGSTAQVQIDSGTLRKVRSGVLQVILEHRAKMRLPEPKPAYKRAVQLQLRLV